MQLTQHPGVGAPPGERERGTGGELAAVLDQVERPVTTETRPETVESLGGGREAEQQTGGVEL